MTTTLDLQQLIYIDQGRVMTDSFAIAGAFSKTHDNVLRDIRTQISKLNLAGEGVWGVANFEDTHYTNPQNGQYYPKYNLTEDAFSLIAMSYVTPEAMRMKIRFLQEFRRMRETIFSLSMERGIKPTPVDSYLIEDPVARARKWADEEEQRGHLSEVLTLQAPKVAAFDTFLESAGTRSVAEAAQALGTGQNRLFRFLREQRILKEGDNLPYQSFLDRGLFTVVESPKTTRSGTLSFRTTRVTAKGMAFLHEQYRAKSLMLLSS